MRKAVVTMRENSMGSDILRDDSGFSSGNEDDDEKMMAEHGQSAEMEYHGGERVDEEDEGRRGCSAYCPWKAGRKKENQGKDVDKVPKFYDKIPGLQFLFPLRGKWKGMSPDGFNITVMLWMG